MQLHYIKFLAEKARDEIEHLKGQLPIVPGLISHIAWQTMEDLIGEILNPPKTAPEKHVCYEHGEEVLYCEDSPECMSKKHGKTWENCEDGLAPDRDDFPPTHPEDVPGEDIESQTRDALSLEVKRLIDEVAKREEIIVALAARLSGVDVDD
jgi:hypothetical protein